MIKKLRSIILAAILAAVAITSSVSIVSATGQCATAWVALYSGLGASGSVRTYCYGVNDSNYSGETSTIMGPLSGGNYLPDFDSNSSTSGVSSYIFSDISGGPNISVCFYVNRSFDGLVQFDHNSGTYDMGIGVNNVTESFAFTDNGFCPGT